MQTVGISSGDEVFLTGDGPWLKEGVEKEGVAGDRARRKSIGMIVGEVDSASTTAASFMSAGFCT